MRVATQPEVPIIPAGEFKAKCLKLMDECKAGQYKIAITKRGTLVGHFVPVAPTPKPFRSVFGRSPNIRIPDSAEWMKLKETWADEWEDSTKKLAHLVHNSGNGKRQTGDR